MKTTIRWLIVATAALGISMPAIANQHGSQSEQEMRANCIVCCMASRPDVRDQLEIHYDECASKCSAVVRFVYNRLMG